MRCAPRSQTGWRPADAGDGEVLDLPGRVVRLAGGSTDTLVVFAPDAEVLAAAWDALAAAR